MDALRRPGWHTLSMTIKRTPRPRDPIQLGKLMVDIATGQMPDAVDDGKDAAAASLGKRGGSARARNLTPEERAEGARKAATSRWQKGPAVLVKKERV
jgi:hypothetical protein